MTKVEKELLLHDLCARLPYGIICKCTYPVNNETTDGEDVLFTNDYEIEGIRRVGAGFAGDRRWYEITFGGETYDINDDGIKVVPYLRSMSSMTKEERLYFHRNSARVQILVDEEKAITKPFYGYTAHLIDWLNEHHFDYRGLIERGLALEAPEGIYNETNTEKI